MNSHNAQHNVSTVQIYKLHPTRILTSQCELCSILGDTVSPRRGRKVTLRIAQRFHFSSALKRMSAVCALTQASHSGPAHMAAVKGAPETLREMVSL